MLDLTVIILTYNEEIHISRSISNVKGFAKDVFILDSGSTDKTLEISKNLGAKVFYREFDSYAKQRNYAIKELPVETEWILFLDADEYLTEELKQEIQRVLPDTKKDGFYLKRRLYFMGKWIRYGGYYPTLILRLFKKDKGIVKREINEHIEVEGSVCTLENDFIDENLKSISFWIEKHNKYATYEAMELLKYNQRKKENEKDEFAKLFGTQAQRKRWIREYIWNPLMPPLVRPFFYFTYRYLFRFGFLDGKRGFIYHFLQGLWFYLLIDIKYIEMRDKERNSHV